MGAVDPSRAEAAKRFAKAVAAKKAEKRTEATGTVVKSGGSTMVRIDGAAMPTPCDSTVTLNDGDRVTVKAENHRLVITGNLTNNAVDQNLFNTTIDPIEEKTNCIAITADGIEVGNVRYGRWVGPRCRMGNQAFSIVGENGQVLSSFKEDRLEFGDCRIETNKSNMNIYSAVDHLTLSVNSYDDDPADAFISLSSGNDGIEIMSADGSRAMSMNYMVIGAGGSFITVSDAGVTVTGGLDVIGPLTVNGQEVSTTPPATEEGEE